MFVNNINPVLFKLGNLEIRYYGIIYALGFIITYVFLKYYIKKGKISIPKERLDDLMLYLMLGVVIGARLGEFLFYDIQIFWINPLEILKIWHGGLSFHGGLIGAAIALTLFIRKHKLDFIQLADALVIPASLALALGRIANFTNHELYGPITNVPWCVQFMGAEGCRHPYQIYAAISHFIMFIILLTIYKKQAQKGTTFWSFVLIYGIFRISTDFFREQPKYFGLETGQWLSLAMVVFSLFILYKKMEKKISRSQLSEQE